MKKFESSKLRQLDLTKISGGYTTNTCEGTTEVSGPISTVADQSKDGDWYSTC